MQLKNQRERNIFHQGCVVGATKKKTSRRKVTRKKSTRRKTTSRRTYR